jgi:hypothetical protein
MLLPQQTGPVQGQRRVGQFLHPFVPDFGEPKFDGFSLRAWNRLNKAQ